MTLTTLVDGLHFPEGPRWRDGALFFSDFYQHAVFRIQPQAALERVVDVAEQPSGLGWLPDGRMLIVSMLDRRVLRLEADGKLSVHADLMNWAAWHCNDMVVDQSGRAYVGNFGFDSHGGAPERGADLLAVEANGEVSVAANDLLFPNGTVITPDGKTLIIGETRGQRLTAFDIDAAGRLGTRRVWADLGHNYPDGICLDAEGCVWVADPRNNCVLRVAQGGAVHERVDLDRGAFACTLGGDSGKELFICAANGSGETARSERGGCIYSVAVDVPASLPPSP